MSSVLISTITDLEPIFTDFTDANKTIRNGVRALRAAVKCYFTEAMHPG